MIRLATLMVWLLPGIASAHGVRVSVAVGDGAISGAASFADGSPMAEAAVELRTAEQPPESLALFRTRTVADGRFALLTPREPGEFRVIVDDGIGHRGETTITLLAGDLSGQLTQAPTAHSPWRDWLSGLGYLFGLFGIGSWWLARRRTAPSRN